MKRFVLVICLCGLLALPAMAVAGVFAPSNEFQGRVEGDPNTYFGFDLGKSNGKQRVKHVTGVLPMSCYNGDQGMLPVRVHGPFKVNGIAGLLVGLSGETAARTKALATAARERTHRHRPRIFAGDGDVDTPIGQGEAFLFGFLNRHGKAFGYIQVYLQTDTFGRCYSGGLNWKVKRGATVAPPPSMGGLGR